MNTVKIDFKQSIGKIKPMHGINNAPAELGDELFHYLGEAGIYISRLHDMGGYFGGNRFADVPNIFRNFDADENDPASYDFAFTDWLLENLVKQGVKILYRLGVSIETSYYIKSYRVFPPKDFLKWAKICEHIIMHYNEGWANGFHYGIKYWEIWNEPDLGDCMWQGTHEQFFKLYVTCASYLKDKFPDLKIGGYGSCGFYNILPGAAAVDSNIAASRERYMIFFHEFMKYISDKEHSAPLDFFSWHSYSGIEENFVFSEYVRSQLDSYGFTQAESFLNEWNVGRTAFRGMSKDAAMITAMMCRMQNSTLDMLVYYDGQVHTSYGGLFDPVKYVTYKAYYSFKTFSEMYKLKNQNAVECDAENIYCIAASDDKNKAVLFSNIADYEQPITVLLPVGKADYYIVSEKYDYEKFETEINDGKLVLTLPENSIILLMTSC